jgi:Glycosyltransferase sugar-binding region containing DXD motif/Alpha 1,4-glycosyltransferase conserved region
MIPLRRLGYTIKTSDRQDLFHFVVTTDLSAMSWRAVRAIEGVFYHHPNAHVMVHSATSGEGPTKLQLFQETGYNLTIVPFNLEEKIRSVKTKVNPMVKEMFISKLPQLARGRNWVSHQSDIVRFLVMFEYGGVYFDTDVYAQRPISKAFTNSIGEQSKGRLNGAAMILEAQHPFVEMALDYIFINYNETNMLTWEIIGPGLVTSIISQNDFPTKPIHILDEEAFQPIKWNDVNGDCFGGHKTYDLNRTLAIHLNSHITSAHTSLKSGTQCDMILHEYCIFCDEIHTLTRPTDTWVKMITRSFSHTNK